MPTVFEADLARIVARAGLSHGSAALSSEKAGTAVGRRVRSAGPLRLAASPRAPSSERVDGGTAFRFVSVDVRHGFLAQDSARDGRAPDRFVGLRCRPTPVTAARLRLFGMTCSVRPDGIDIVWNSAHRDAATRLLDALRDQATAMSAQERDGIVRLLLGEPLLFTIVADDPNFIGYTDMPLDARIGDPPRIWSNRVLAGIVANKEGVAADFALWSDPVAGDDVAKTTEAVVDDRPGYLADRSARLADERWLSIAGATLPDARTDTDESDRVRERSDPARQERARLDRDARCLALLELHLALPSSASAAERAGLPMDFYPAEGDPYFRPAVYTLRFAARTARWRYLVSARTGALDPASLSILADDADAGFTLVAPQVLPDGRMATCLASVDPLPIRAYPDRALALVGAPPVGDPHPRTLVPLLPNARPDRLSLAAAAAPGASPPPVFADIHVFV